MLAMACPRSCGRISVAFGNSTHTLGNAMCAVAVPYIISEVLFDGVEAYSHEVLCRSARPSISRKCFFELWIRTREPIVTRCIDIRSGPFLLREYRASFLQARFLRSVLDLIPTAVVAGGFAVAAHLLQSRLPTFEPNDVDIFVTDSTHIRLIENLYRRDVLTPQNLTMSPLTFGELFTSKRDVSLFGALGLSSEDVNDFGVLTSGDLHSVYVGAEEMATKTIFCANQIDYPDESLHKVLMRSVQELRRAWLFLPRATTPRAYDVCSQSYMLPESASGERLPVALLAIKIIHISHDAAASHSTPEEFVWSGFDFLHCCLSVRVRSDLSYHVHGSEAALDVVRRRCLTFRHNVDVNTRQFKMKQLRRVLKYSNRGFHFPAAPSLDHLLYLSKLGFDGAMQHMIVSHRRLALQAIPSDGYAVRQRSSHGSSSSNASETRANIDMRRQRAIAAMRHDVGFDYWVECEGGTNSEADPLRVKLAKSALLNAQP